MITGIAMVNKIQCAHILVEKQNQALAEASEQLNVKDQECTTLQQTLSAKTKELDYRAKEAETIRYQKSLAREQLQRKLDVEEQRTSTAKKQLRQSQSLFTGMGMGSSSSYSMTPAKSSSSSYSMTPAKSSYDYKIPMLGSTTSKPKVTTKKKTKPKVTTKKKRRSITINL